MTGGGPSQRSAAGLNLAAEQETIGGLEAEGHTVVAVARGARVLGVIALADTLRPEAAEAVAALRQAGVTPVLVTGDNARAAAHIARQAGIDQVHAGVLPDGKASLVGQSQSADARVAMIGDGINDALEPRLAAFAARHPGVFTGYRIDVDTDTRTPARFAVMSIPTLALPRDGAEVARGDGLIRDSDLDGMLAEAISGPPPP